MSEMKLDPNDMSRFANLTILTTTYKTVSGHSISTDVLIPKSLTEASTASSSPSPIILRYHGGGFIAASSLFPSFFQPWYFELAERHSAVIVSPNYRLVPEASMDDVLEDIEDHWKWIHAELPSFIQQQTNNRVSVDTKRILTGGDSAGGYLSLMAGLLHPDEIRASVAAYPCLDLKAAQFKDGAQGPTLGHETVPYSVVEEHLKKVREGVLPSVVSEDPKFERALLMLALTHYGLAKDMFPNEKRYLFPFDKLDDGARFPRGGVFVWHGNEDSIVPVIGSKRLKEKIEKLDPELPFYLAVRPGEHGFDHDAKIDEPWMAEGLEKLVKAWLK
ncbi:uncharacterized protein CTRU02_207829 [Colletotrichum truncatum]|uniref:Uncharacterized protein n=1 Tax=Colletotrichum truncatum TaxID=5467 RepID=A0ACC3Z1W4_COLTU|nr:uncharacterized protein CTRU02_15173 [Colletotrichum truncatum]KAF6781390.1 hypothetical protein CTRU02_15173 [Colletotrichum truncatum]